MKIDYNYLIVLLMLGFLACKPKAKDADFVPYIEDVNNEFHKVVNTNGWHYDIQYKPYPYMLIKERIDLNNSTEVQNRIKQLEGTLWFNVSLKRDSSEINPLKFQVADLDEYNSRLDYFLNQSVKNFSLQYGSKVLEPISYYFENNYGLTPDDVMIVGFLIPQNEPKVEEVVISYNDQLFKNGIIKATFKEKEINNINSL